LGLPPDEVAEVEHFFDAPFPLSPVPAVVRNWPDEDEDSDEDDGEAIDDDYYFGFYMSMDEIRDFAIKNNKK